MWDYYIKLFRSLPVWKKLGTDMRINTFNLNTKLESMGPDKGQWCYNYYSYIKYDIYMLFCLVQDLGSVQLYIEEIKEKIQKLWETICKNEPERITKKMKRLPYTTHRNYLFYILQLYKLSKFLRFYSSHLEEGLASSIHKFDFSQFQFSALVPKILSQPVEQQPSTEGQITAENFSSTDNQSSTLPNEENTITENQQKISEQKLSRNPPVSECFPIEA